MTLGHRLAPVFDRGGIVAQALATSASTIRAIATAGLAADYPEQSAFEFFIAPRQAHAPQVVQAGG
jgi:hypothetical protein